MSFDRNDYLNWYFPRMKREDDSIDLHSSGVQSLDPAQINVENGDPWKMAERFEEALACWLDLHDDEILFTPGAIGGTLLALLGLVEPGQEVLLESPIFEPMRRQAERLGLCRRFYRLRKDNWRLPLEQIESSICDDTGMVMITEPHNPSGVLSPREDVLRLADLAATKGALLLVNEVYRLFAGTPSYHGEKENIVVVSSLSKLTGAYWARLGWLSANLEVIRRLSVARKNMSIPNAPSAAVGLGVLAKIDAFIASARRLTTNGLKTVDQWVNLTPDIRWTKPMGPGLGCIILPTSVNDDVAFAERLHDRYSVLTVPGTFFEVPGTLRICWLQAKGRLEEGLERIEEALIT